VPDWMTGAVPGQEMVTEVSGARPGGRFVDFGPVHLLTTGALAELAGQLERASVDATRFRPNLVLDALRDPVPGQELRIGDVVLRVVLPTPRCVAPASRTRDQRRTGSCSALWPGTTGPSWATWAGRPASASTQRSCAQVSSRSARSSGSRSVTGTSSLPDHSGLPSRSRAQGRHVPPPRSASTCGPQGGPQVRGRLCAGVDIPTDDHHLGAVALELVRTRPNLDLHAVPPQRFHQLAP